VSPLARLALLGAGVGAAFAAVTVLLGHSAGDVRDLVGSTGVPGALLFVALSAGLTVALFPFPLQAAAAGVLFGTAAGTAVSIAGGTLGAIAAFEIARHGGARAVEQLLGDRLAGVQEFVEREGFVAVLYARILPGVPRDVANYAFGLTRVHLGAFALATLLGIAPRAYAYTALGGSLSDLSSPEAIVAVALLVAMGVLGLLLVRRDVRARRAAGALRR
jgi:uncharacterized membrane protein YdjX (TVP38/TMEM64 family)